MQDDLNTPEGTAAKLFRMAVSATGLYVFAYSFYNVITTDINADWCLLSLVTILVVSRIDIKIPRSAITITLSDMFIFTSLLLFGVHHSVVLAGADAALCSLRFKNRQKLIPFNAALMSFSVYLSGELATRIFGSIAGQGADAQRLLSIAGTLSLTHYAVNSSILNLAIALKHKRKVIENWREFFLWTSVSYFAGAIAACFIVKLIGAISFYAFIVAVPILGITYLTYRFYLDKLEASIKHAEQIADLHLRTIEALAIAIDAKDEVTHEHVRRVQIYATGLARLFGLSEAEIEALNAGALLHDIGKLAVPDYILNKPGPLTPAEFEKMKVHTIVGAEILERVGFPYPVVPVVRHHHERWDGRGYPDGLRGDMIPITARILTVADCFDAVREDRQYRKAMTREQAIKFLKDNSGAIFDPEVVRVFIEHLPEFEAEIRRQGVDFKPAPVETRSLSKPTADRTANSGQKAFERIRSAHREVIALYEIAQTIGTSLDLRDTFAVFSSRLESIVSYTTCVLYLHKLDSGQIEAIHTSGLNSEKFKGRKIAPGAGITGWVVVNRHPMYNCDPRLDFDALKLNLDEQYLTAMVVPLLKDEDVLGALALYSMDRGSYEPDDLRLVEAVAKLASDAIANALHHEKVEASALTDPLSGLANARALRHKFEEAADRARRHSDGFCVVMLDLDGFKRVNDQFGHQAGDILLKDVAQFLSSRIRSTDFISRYAGDEFVAILQVGPDEVQELIKRLQRAVEAQAFGPGLRIGLSAGWACFGIDGSTLDELLIAADRAMYADKAKRKRLARGAEASDTLEASRYKVM
jgi:diguanylate cyclase (GGDEF)-like protein/putative nucleotidyltransferase with HDIG domain